MDKIILFSAVTKRSQSLAAAATFLQKVVDQPSLFFSGTRRRKYWSTGCVRHAKGT